MHKVAFILMAIGGLNWLVYGLFMTDVGALLGGMDSVIARVVYVLVGVATVVELLSHRKSCKECTAPSGSGM